MCETAVDSSLCFGIHAIVYTCKHTQMCNIFNLDIRSRLFECQLQVWQLYINMDPSKRHLVNCGEIQRAGEDGDWPDPAGLAKKNIFLDTITMVFSSMKMYVSGQQYICWPLTVYTLNQENNSRLSKILQNLYVPNGILATFSWTERSCHSSKAS